MLDCWNRNSEKRPNFNTIIKRLVKDPPPVSDYCTPKSLPASAEKPEENAAVTCDEPIGKIPVPKIVKPESR